MTALSLIEAFCDEFAHTAPFDHMERATLRQLAEQAELAYFPAGTTVYQAGQAIPYLFLIKEGRVGSRYSDNEIHEYTKGDLFPLGAILTDQSAAATMEALEDTFLYRLPGATVEALRQQSPAFADYCLNRIGHLLLRSRQELQATLSLDSRHAALSTTIGQIMTQPISCAPDTPLLTALQQMQAARIGSILIVDGQGIAHGIYTLQDLLRTVLSQADLNAPISQYMNSPLISLSPDALATDAALSMAQHRIRHIPVIEQGRLLGMVSERDLFGLQRVSLGSIERQLEQADSPETYAVVAEQIRQLGVNLLAQGLAAEPLARLTATLHDRLSARIIEQHLEPLRAQGMQLTWLVFGSEGRQEQTLATDQDNGLIFSCPTGESADVIRTTLLPVCATINHILDRCGIPLCKGNIMAMNPACCLSLDEWENQFASWVDDGTPDSLLAASIYFDFRPIWGDDVLAEALFASMQARIRERPRFLWMLTRNALLHEPPLGLIRDFVTQQHEGHAVIDLKAAGTVFFVDAARIFALAAGIRISATTERLRQAGAILNIAASRIESWIDAFQYLQMLRLRCQQAEIARGEIPGNLVRPDQLTVLDRRVLKEALQEAKRIQRSLNLHWPA
ncbi:CBS domain-containing protein [Burkholderiaceae bacterium DAT-1]|nr:CBS domain-containing protein [Burkholderiaceae bacterium DAT-1]